MRRYMDKNWYLCHYFDWISSTIESLFEKVRWKGSKMYSILDFKKEVNLIKMRVFSWHVNIEQSNLSCNGNFNYENVYTCMFCLTAVNLIEEQVIYYYNSS